MRIIVWIHQIDFLHTTRFYEVFKRNYVNSFEDTIVYWGYNKMFRMES